MLFFEPSMGEKVLRISATEGGDHLAFVDPVYWNIDVNGEPVTDRLLEALIQAEHMYKVDLAERRLRFKAPVEALRAEREKLAAVIQAEPQLPPPRDPGSTTT